MQRVSLGRLLRAGAPSRRHDARVSGADLSGWTALGDGFLSGGHCRSSGSDARALAPLDPDDLSLTGGVGSEPQRAAGGTLTTGPEPSAKEVIEVLSTEDTESFPRLQRPFVDRLWLEAKAGNGGNPAPNAIRKQPNAPQKGPAYGGHGGSVFLKATHLIESFLDISDKIKSEHGGDGSEMGRGLHGKDFMLQVPLGTIVRERVNVGEKTKDNRRIYLPQFRYQFLRSGDTYIVARGGVGGIGPQSFKKHDGRVGTPGQRVRLELELRLMNDCAFVGLPNAGKTSLVAALSRAHTRIGPEEFSTTRPHVGLIRFRDSVEIRLCDLPGLKQGASEDKDMGRRILRHTYRSRVLAYVVDVARGERSAQETLDEVEMLRQEAIQFDPLNAKKPWMVIGTKCDSLHRDALYHLDSLHFRLQARYGPQVPVVGVSSRFGLGLTRVVRTIRQLIYPDLLEPVRRLPAERFVHVDPGVLHGRFQGQLPSLGDDFTPPLLVPPPDGDVSIGGTKLIEE